MRKLLGFQIANEIGSNIQGDDEDPSSQPSFAILSVEEATRILEANSESKLLLMPIYEGDIENPIFIH